MKREESEERVKKVKWEGERRRMKWVRWEESEVGGSRRVKWEEVGE